MSDTKYEPEEPTAGEPKFVDISAADLTSNLQLKVQPNSSLPNKHEIVLVAANEAEADYFRETYPDMKVVLESEHKGYPLPSNFPAPKVSEPSEQKGQIIDYGPQDLKDQLRLMVAEYMVASPNWGVDGDDSDFIAELAALVRFREAKAATHAQPHTCGQVDCWMKPKTPDNAEGSGLRIYSTEVDTPIIPADDSLKVSNPQPLKPADGTCPTCGGSGNDCGNFHPPAGHDCLTCGGTGKTPAAKPDHIEHVHEMEKTALQSPPRPSGEASEPTFDGRTCPACGNRTLMIASGGYLTCGWLDCPNPDTGDAIQNLITAAEVRGAVQELEALERVYAHHGDDVYLLPDAIEVRLATLRQAGGESTAIAESNG